LFEKAVTLTVTPAAIEEPLKDACVSQFVPSQSGYGPNIHKLTARPGICYRFAKGIQHLIDRICGKSMLFNDIGFLRSWRNFEIGKELLKTVR